MQGSNRSGLQCFQHPREQFTNFCVSIDCLKPLCPDCVQTHTKLHHKQQIESWKHTTSKAAHKIKQTLQELRSIYQIQRQIRSPKTPQSVQAQNLQRLNHLRQKYHRLVDEIFNTHENTVRNQVRQHYRFDQPDTSKLKMAIEEIEKVLMKLAHPNSVLPALKKALLLDQQALIDFFSHLRNQRPNVPTEQFFTENTVSFQSLRNILEQSIRFDNIQRPATNTTTTNIQRRQKDILIKIFKPYDYKPLKITLPDYFKPQCKNKLLHFFLPCSFELKLLRIQEAQKSNWKTVEFKAKKELPCYFKSIATPNGDIYLTGGSQQELRCKQIYKYNFERNTLDFVSNMIQERSSHSICYLDNKIYLIGGFSGPEGDVTRQCEVFDLLTMTCTRIAPLNTPSANSAAASFAGQYIFKFGGILNKQEGNSLIEMYSIKNNRWIVVGIQIPKGIPSLQLLSFSAAIQINQKDILVFGGYDNTEQQKPERLCYALSVSLQKSLVSIRNFNTNPLPYAQGFWNNNPIIQGKRVIGLQNVTDQENELTALADQRRVVIFNGERWI